jgi:heme-degrading monooxygenase HmoA
MIRAEHLEEYIAYIWETGGREYKNTPGNRGAWILSRIDGDRGEVVTLSFWESLEAISGFAGPDIEKPVLYAEDERYLLGPTTIRHYEVSE